MLETKTYAAAMNGADHEKWKLAVEEKTDSLASNNTWVITAKPRDQKVISGKYVFKIKTDSEGKADRYKARWVVRGFEQEYGVDFHDIRLSGQTYSLSCLAYLAGRLTRWA